MAECVGNPRLLIAEMTSNKTTIPRAIRGTRIQAFLPFDDLAGMVFSLSSRTGTHNQAIESLMTIYRSCRQSKLSANVIIDSRMILQKDVFWSGYHAYFQEPDGNLWEVAWNPFFNVE